MSEKQPDPVVLIQDLTVRFGAVTAVDGLSTSLSPGSVHVLLGRNGSGKSTTIRALLGLLKPKGGSSRVFGLDSWADRRTIMGRTGVVPETPDIPPLMTAESVARFAARVHSSFDGQQFDERLGRFSVPTDRPFRSLSKGQQKQVSLALALATGPELLILDDPTLGLDAVARKSLFEELIGELADRGTTVFITTHDMAAVEGVADAVGIIRDGRMVLDESLEKLKTRFRRVVVSRQAADDAAFASNHATGGGLELTTIGDTVSTVLTHSTAEIEARLAASAIQVEPMSLEDIFIAVCETEQGGLS
jgi:ABC-2 type transport system ATP-binding protein